ncbi:phosphate:acyl-[acyl carrier protein] acyltransferase [Peptoclostridium litorale DSM 5388]|uniref:Phosphate acyltransferase n=1 Tax=Peptoclostridium litorale DSM 5388 TaxID=1121324 RepID=A0A069RAN8_PEPLI|nr:phosphate acyltransferase PlsX [Peptoclostridium litorale]KDR94099.1 phosphate acyltransferase PlsX [Peptoclostridium litorale DSM 5388]SIN80846.1 phosphate:acyl-[acyl carrier protein] acyltransferase [Peptoclostridium litorale DSM 5388]
MKIAVDGMGGDNAPFSTVKGAVDAIKELEVEIILTGDSEELEKELLKYEYDKSRIQVVHTSQKIENEDKPVKAIRAKKDSSMVVAMQLVKDKKADAVVSAGNTGALLAGGLFVIGRIRGIDRPALCVCLPTKKGFSIMLDAGANADCKPLNIRQFALMGSIYSSKVMNVEKPVVKIVNVGSEEGKGNELTKQSSELLKSEKGIIFGGNIEARDIPSGQADVIVCDGFTGNVVLKLIEGVAGFLMSNLKDVFMSSLKSKIAALLVKKDLSDMKKRLDYSEYGGAPLIGVDGALIKAHGSSDSNAFKNAIRQAAGYAKANVVGDISDSMVSLENE